MKKVNNLTCVTELEIILLTTEMGSRHYTNGTETTLLHYITLTGIAGLKEVIVGGAGTKSVSL